MEMFSRERIFAAVTYQESSTEYEKTGFADVEIFQKVKVDIHYGEYFDKRMNVTLIVTKKWISLSEQTKLKASKA